MCIAGDNRGTPGDAQPSGVTCLAWRLLIRQNAAVTINPVAEWVNPWRLMVINSVRGIQHCAAAPVIYWGGPAVQCKSALPDAAF